MSVRIQMITFEFLPSQAMRCLLTGCFLLHIWLRGSCRSFYESHKNIYVHFRLGLTTANHSALRQILEVMCFKIRGLVVVVVVGKGVGLGCE